MRGAGRAKRRAVGDWKQVGAGLRYTDICCSRYGSEQVLCLGGGTTVRKEGVIGRARRKEGEGKVMLCERETWI